MGAKELRKNVTRTLVKKLSEYERGFKRKTIRVILYLGAFYLIYLFCAGDYGLFRIYRLTQQRDTLLSKYQEIVTEAADCSFSLRRMKKDPYFVEWLARTRYGYSRADDVIYHLKVNSR